MKFEFKLEAVKKHRRILKDLANREYLAAKFVVDQKLAQIKLMYAAVDGARERAETLQSQPGNTAPALVQIEEFITGQGIRIQKARQEVRELMAVLEEKHDELVEKVKDHKVIEKLEEKQFKKFKAEQNKREQKRADDMSIMRFKRGS